MVPVSNRRLQASGGSLGTVFPRARRISDKIIMHKPRAVSQVRWRIKKADRVTSPPAITKPKPDQI